MLHTYTYIYIYVLYMTYFEEDTVKMVVFGIL